MNVHALLARCQELGAEFIPGPDGKLKVRAPAPLPEELQVELKQHKAEVLALLAQAPKPSDAPRPCQGCGREMVLTDTTEWGTRVYDCPGCESFALVPEKPGRPYVPRAHEPEAVKWLWAKLVPGPQRIAPLIAEWLGGQLARQKDGTQRWEGGKDGTDGHDVAGLHAARWALGVEAYEGPAGKMWWRLPQAVMQ